MRWPIQRWSCATANGALILANNDWQDNAAQAALITAAGLAPTQPA